MSLTEILLYVQAFCRVVIGLTFLLSSVSKARDIVSFTQTVRNFRLLPTSLNGIAGVLFVVSEFAVVLFMIIGGLLLVPGFALAIFLLLLFCTALVSVLVRRLRTSCNCFGASDRQVSRIDIGRNLGFAFCAAIGCIARAWIGMESLSMIAWVLTGIGACVFVVIWIQLGEIVQLLNTQTSRP